MNFLRLIQPGGTYFFTLVTFNRQPIFGNPDSVATLREAFRYVLDRHPFVIDACVILPNHIHMIWTLPEEDHDYPSRIRLLKSRFTYRLASKPTWTIPFSRKLKKEQAIWQRRYWEHMIRDQEDFKNHVEYIHFNPVKHGLVKAAIDWPYSSFHQYVKQGLYSVDWAEDTGAVEVIGGE